MKAFATEYGAKLAREFHPLRLQRWAFSDLNPLLGWLAPAAQAVKAQRQTLAADDPARKVESVMSDLTSASLDCFRGLRDAVAEATFFQIYGNLFAFCFSDERDFDGETPRIDPRELPFVQKALASVDKGGYAEAVARVAVLLAYKNEPLPLSRLQLAHEMIEEYRELLPELAPDEARRIEGEQEIIARYEPDKAVATLPALLARQKDRERLLSLLENVLADKRVQRIQPSAEQEAMLVRIRRVLGSTGRRPAKVRRGGTPVRRKVRAPTVRPRAALAKRAGTTT